MLDFADIMGRSQGLVPDYRQQKADDQLYRAREQVMSEKQRAAQREQQFKHDFERTLLAKNPDAIMQLMARYPEYAEQVKPVWQTMDERDRQSRLTLTGSIYANANAGNIDRAAALLEQNIAAERAAGGDVADDEAILAGLRSENPVERQAAIQTIGIHLAAATGDKFTETYKGLNPVEGKSPVQREYDWRVQQFGKASADEWLATKDTDIVTVEAGGSVFDKRDFAKGGDPASTSPGAAPKTAPAPVGSPVANAGTLVRSLFPGVSVTQNRRNPKSALGRANPKSWHNRSGGAVDVKPIPGMSFDQFIAQIEAAGYPIIEKRDEVANPSKHSTGPHWHVVIGDNPAAPRVVRSVQEARKLPPGTQFRTPDGRTLKVPG